MKKFAEYVSPGHPDKVADYISQYLLDRYIENDPEARYAVEVQIKGFTVTLGGEIASRCRFTFPQIRTFVREAVNEIGYTADYMREWGSKNTICGDFLEVYSHIKHQSPDIARGLAGWGDQGIFFGYAHHEEDGENGLCGMPYEHAVAKKLCKVLYDSGIGGLDIKTQVITDDGNITRVIVAIPLRKDGNVAVVEELVRTALPGSYELTVNGTGRYVKHSSIADCGTTGRKLVADFYGGACRIGGGSPWTKDASKADLTLNLLARKLALQYAREYGCDVYTSLACCIGRTGVDVSVCDAADNILWEGQIDRSPKELRREFRLDKPIFASMCRWGLFGEFQQDKEWEK